jgi:hypothetical protein
VICEENERIGNWIKIVVLIDDWSSSYTLWADASKLRREATLPGRSCDGSRMVGLARAGSRDYPLINAKLIILNTILEPLIRSSNQDLSLNIFYQLVEMAAPMN